MPLTFFNRRYACFLSRASARGHLMSPAKLSAGARAETNRHTASWLPEASMAEAVMEHLCGSMPMTIAIITDSGQHLADRQFPTAGAGYQRIFNFVIRFPVLAVRVEEPAATAPDARRCGGIQPH